MKLKMVGFKKQSIIRILVFLLFFWSFANQQVEAKTLIDNVRGHILLQVEAKGEAWYVNPKDDFRYYLQDGQIAYIVLREFGLGITNHDLKQIPVGIKKLGDQIDSDNDSLIDKLEEALGTDPFNQDSDGDGFTDGLEVANSYNPLGEGRQAINQNLINRLKGRILLQVEAKGEAWYVNPADGKRYYLKDGDAAYEVMKFLSLGITNDNLEQIQTGSLNFTIETPASTEPNSIPSTPQTVDDLSPNGRYQWFDEHQTTQSTAITKINDYLEKLVTQDFPDVELTDKVYSWDKNLLTFSFTTKKIFISAQIKGQVVVTDTKVKLGLDFPDIVDLFISTEKIDAVVQEKFNELFDN